MADVPVGAVPAPPPAPETTQDPKDQAAAVAVRRAAAREAKLAAVSAGLAKLQPEAPIGAPAPVPADKTPGPAADREGAGLGGDAPAAAPPAADKAPAQRPTPPPAPPAPPAPAAPKPAGEVDQDPKAAKGLEALDRRAKAFREEQATHRAEIEQRSAELARRAAELDARGSSLDGLRDLARRDPAAALAQLGIESETDWERVGTAAYPRTKAGKSDPRAAQAVAQSARERELDQRIETIERQNKDLIENLRGRDTQAAQERYITNYLDGVVKAVPADKTTLIGKLVAKNPERARAALLETGKRMERDAAREAGALRPDGTYKYDPSFTPEHSELIAEYERTRRAELEEQGVDVEAMLAPAAAAPQAPQAPSRRATTLDPTTGAGIRPRNTNPTRAEKLAAVTAGLKRLDAGN